MDLRERLAELALLEDVQLLALCDFNPDEPRDERGRWTTGGGSAGTGPSGERPSRGSSSVGRGYSSHAYLKGGVIHTDNVNDAVRALYEKRKVALHQPREVATLLERLGKVSQEMMKLGIKAPTFDLCKVSVEGTNLFCAESKGIPRIKMPQLEDNKAFVSYLRDKGYGVTDTTERSDHLRATQNELNGAKVAGIASKGLKPDDPTRTIVSRDNYIVDGHHRWAAQVGIDARDNKLGDAQTKISRVDIDIIELLEEADKFTEGKGHRGAGEMTAAIERVELLAAMSRLAEMAGFDPDQPRDWRGRWAAQGEPKTPRYSPPEARSYIPAARAYMPAAHPRSVAHAPNPVGDKMKKQYSELERVGKVAEKREGAGDRERAERRRAAAGLPQGPLHQGPTEDQKLGPMFGPERKTRLLPSGRGSTGKPMTGEQLSFRPHFEYQARLEPSSRWKEPQVIRGEYVFETEHDAKNYVAAAGYNRLRHDNYPDFKQTTDGWRIYNAGAPKAQLRGILKTAIVPQFAIGPGDSHRDEVHLATPHEPGKTPRSTPTEPTKESEPSARTPTPSERTPTPTPDYDDESFEHGESGRPEDWYDQGGAFYDRRNAGGTPFFADKAMRLNGKVYVGDKVPEEERSGTPGEMAWHADIQQFNHLGYGGERGFIGWDNKFHTQEDLDAKVQDYIREHGYPDESERIDFSPRSKEHPHYKPLIDIRAFHERLALLARLEACLAF